MKVTFELPEWTDGRRITVLAGIESVIKRMNGNWYIKVNRCIKCGKCCMDVPDNWAHGKGEDGHCQHLKYEANEYLCKLGINRPYKCCVGDGIDMADCSITWEKI